MSGYSEILSESVAPEKPWHYLGSMNLEFEVTQEMLDEMNTGRNPVRMVINKNSGEVYLRNKNYK